MVECSNRPGLPSPGLREVEHFAGPEFVSFLSEHGVSLIVSAYQAGQLVAVGTHGGKIVVDFHAFDRPLGVAYQNGNLAVAARRQVWLLRENVEIAAEIEPQGRYQKIFLARQSHLTGDVQAHEIAWTNNELMFVNTAFSCLSTLHNEYSFVPQWRPPFISSLVAEDRCHLNGVAIADGKPAYVTALGMSDSQAGWRPQKAENGVVLSIPDGTPIASGLCMPHSPRLHAGDLWVLNSGMGQLLKIDLATGRGEVVAVFPGYARGMTFFGSHAFVGLSRIRETSAFGDLPLSEFQDQLRCGIAVVELTTGKTVATFQFLSGVDEIFDLVLIPDANAVQISGPTLGERDQEIWLAPHSYPFPPTAPTSQSHLPLLDVSTRRRDSNND